MLDTSKDLYNGLIIKTDTIESSPSDFKKSLQNLIIKANREQVSLLWLDLTSNQNEHISVALELGFEFHNCETKKITLTYKVTNDAYIPVAATHTVGVGAVVINKKNELLLVRDRIHTSSSIYKLPGGMLENAQSLEESIVREVWEESGIRTKVIKMVSLLNSHPYKFNKSNIYIVFQLKALSSLINVIDTKEIELALWMDLDEFFSYNEISKFQKNLVNLALYNKGFSLREYKSILTNKKYIELYG